MIPPRAVQGRLRERMAVTRWHAPILSQPAQFTLELPELYVLNLANLEDNNSARKAQNDRE